MGGISGRITPISPVAVHPFTRSEAASHEVKSKDFFTDSPPKDPCTQIGHLQDLYKLLTDTTYRVRIVHAVPDPVIQNFWFNEFPNYPKDATAPILTRLTKFLLSPTLSYIFQNDGPDFYRVMNTKQVFVANLGRVGQDTQALLGSILVSQIQLATMRRTRIPRPYRVPFYLYVDEFQNFTSPAFARIFSEAGKFKLCMTLAHQYAEQIDKSTREAILKNAGTIIETTKERGAYYLTANGHREKSHGKLPDVSNAVPWVQSPSQTRGLMPNGGPTHMSGDTQTQETDILPSPPPKRR